MKPSTYTLGNTCLKALVEYVYSALAKRVVPLLTVLALPVGVQAQLSYSVDNGHITITGSCQAGRVKIPTTIEGLPVTSIGGNSFGFCTSLTGVAIPSSVTSIGGYAFDSCTNLTSVTIGSGVISIGAGAFAGCTSLTNITIPVNVTSIGYAAFAGCASFSAIAVDANNPAYVSLDGVLFDKGLTTLIQCPATKTGNYTIPSSVTSIGEYAFYGCASLTSVTVGSSVTSIGALAFSGCTSLTSVAIPDSVTTIGDRAFWNCSRMVAIAVSADNPAYASVDGVLFDKTHPWLMQCPGGKAGSYTVPGNVTGILGYAFSGCSNLVSVTIPSSVTFIAGAAFSGATSLTCITIPNSVTEIQDYAFSGCTSLTRVAIPDSVTTIAIGEFSGCTSLTNISIPDGVRTVGSFGFEACTSLVTVSIPNSVTSIQGYAFLLCTNLNGVYFLGDAPKLVEPVFDGDPSVTLYHLPGAKDWGKALFSVPTGLWVLPNPVILSKGSRFGVRADLFGFTISWATNASVVVEACTSLAHPLWTPISTNTLTGGSSEFSDPQWAQYPSRFYRLSTP